MTNLLWMYFTSYIKSGRSASNPAGALHLLYAPLIPLKPHFVEPGIVFVTLVVGWVDMTFNLNLFENKMSYHPTLLLWALKLAA